MPLSWNEIKTRATTFSKEWKDESSEDAEAKSFWDAFFDVFGVNRRRVATFETHVKKIDGKDGFIDLLWKGVILVEQKSRGKDLDKAFGQAKNYFPGLKDSELPKYILVSDFARFRLYDLDSGGDTYHEFRIEDLSTNVQHFGFLAGYQKRSFKDEDPVNIEAAQMMGRLHDALEGIGYKGHQLEVYLVRLLFCLFADDTGIFEKNIFQEWIANCTSEDGRDLAQNIEALFQVLNKPTENRLSNIDESLAAFPYVNGGLFEERLDIASFDSGMRNLLLQCCALDWGKISPAIFGSLFQSVMNPQERRNLGAHYTSEKNILKLIKPLFLDELRKEFENIRTNKNRLNEFHNKLARLRFLDPACGCGNFLVITYRELRALEIEVIKAIYGDQQVTNVTTLIKVEVDRFYGIEYEEFPAQIAQVAMWLMDHQMNMRVSEEFGEYYVRLPLVKSANISYGNALRTDWDKLLPEGERFDYILGNPPFIGSKMMNANQRKEIVEAFNNADGSGVLDYVTGWYAKAAKYIQGTRSKVGFVSTNSIAQGEQVGVLWNELLNTYKVHIHFAHRTFKWSNEARGVAAVHVVIVGFANYDISEKLLYEYDTTTSEPHELKTQNINPYLVQGNNVLVKSRSNPVCNVPEIHFGNMPLDGGNLLLSDEEKNELLRIEPNAAKFIRQFIGSHEFINNISRWCLWLIDASPEELRKLPEIMKRVQGVKEFREASIAPSTRKFAATPTLFRDRLIPETYIVVPGVSSERRRYIPMGFLTKDVIPSNLVHIVPDASLFLFGVLISEMHMTWVRYVCGRLKSDFRYSKNIVYNNYPFPESVSSKQLTAVEKAAQKVLDARAKFPESSLADLYDPLTMPPVLVKAHQELDKAVDLCYRPQAFPNEAKRIEFLFELYERYTAGMFAGEKKKRSRR